MTGIGRLRTLAGAWDEWGLGGTLAEIADQIERERAEDCYRMGLDYGTVWRVVADMERHFLGHEGMEDSPVARWARELRGALKSDASDGSEAQNHSCVDAAETEDATSEDQKVTRDPAEDVSMSAYDLLPADERDAIAWVREHGGLDYVKKEWRSRVPHDRYEARRQRLLGHIAECETALGRKREIISKLGHRVSDLTSENAELRRRAMPGGCEWPRYTSGEPVRLGDAFLDHQGTVRSVLRVEMWQEGGFMLHTGQGTEDWHSAGERVKRPAPKVLDADGVEIELGDDLYSVEGSLKFHVSHVDRANGKIATDAMFAIDKWADPSLFTHRAPVLAADGEPLEAGQTVYLPDGTPLHVTGIGDMTEGHQTVFGKAGNDIVDDEWDAVLLTHQRLVLDADGVPIKVGDHGWWVEQPGVEIVVKHIDPDECDQLTVCDVHGRGNTIGADEFTHTKPEPPDSWERVEEDAGKDPCGYFGFDGEETCGKCPASGKNCEQTMARDLVRRAKALAERERGE